MDFVADDAAELSRFLEHPSVQAILDDPDCFFSVVTPTGNHLMVSRGVENVLGYSPQEFVALNGLSQLLHPEDRAVAESSYHGLRDGPIELICRGLQKNGEHAWISSRLMIMDGVITAVVAPTTEVMEGAVWAPTPPFI